MYLIPADEVAATLGIARRTLGHWAQHGYFPKPTYLGRRAYYQPAQLETFIQKKAEEAEQAQRPGFICKKCEAPSPIGVGFTDHSPGAREKSMNLTSCQCGYSQKAIQQ